MVLTERQEQAALDHTKSKCVTAGAGTGKTFVLVQKYIDLLENVEDIGVGNILAVTFTEKAAAEMKIRIREALAKKKGPRWDSIRDEFLWAHISTFHSFCAQVLREFPLEAGISPGFAVLDDREAARIRNEAIEMLVHGEPPEACRSALIGVLRAVGVHGMKNSLERLYQRRDEAERFFSALEESDQTVLDAWQAALEQCREEELRAFISEAGDRVAVLQELAARCSGTADPGQAYLRAVEPHLSLITKGDYGAVAALAEIHRDKRFTARMGRQQNWRGDDLILLREAYKNLTGCLKAHSEYLSLAIDPDDPFIRVTLDYLRNLGVVFRVYSGMVDAGKRRRNALDFTDLIGRTHRLFYDHKEIVKAHFCNWFRFILVDEFQDTDPVQNGIVSAILGDLTRASAKLFVVGDPKQSIYLFRDADVTQFRRTRDLIEQSLGGEAVPLDVNFRSTPAIVGFVNAVFCILMNTTSGHPWEFRYDPLTANRSGDTGLVELILVPKAEDQQSGRRAEAEAVARKVQNLVEHEKRRVYWDREGKHLDEPRPAEYRDVAILLERRTSLASLEWALARYGIPYHVHAGLGFYERQEIYDLYNCLRFLENDRDDVALYGLLRSPYFGFSDIRLFSIAEAGSPGISFWGQVQRCAIVHPAPDILAAIGLLSSWLLHARRIPPAELLTRVVSESGISVVFGGTPAGKQAAANVEKLIAIVRDMETGGCSMLSDVVRELALCIDDAEREGDALLDLTGADAVSIMTVHASKGLEFPVVIVPGLAEHPRAGGGSIMVGDGLRLGVAIPNPANDHEYEETAILRVLKREHRQKEEAEQIRLFYVAATRAKDHLVLCGMLPDEIPETLEDGRTRMSWLAYCLRLCEDVYTRGAAEISVPGGEPLTIPVVTDPASIYAELHCTEPVLLTLPEGGIAAEMPAAPVPAGEERHTYSATEIRRYLHSPPAHEGMHRGEGARPIQAAPAADDPVIRGLVVHEILRGRDPATVLRRYGISGGEKAGEYRTLCERFHAAEMMQGNTIDRCEIPFRVCIGGMTFTGAIDRLVRRPDGTWMLIDYKTGAAEGDDQSKKVEEYAVQMTIYLHAAEQILGEAVTAYLYFVDDDRWVEVRVDRQHVLEEILAAAGGIREQGLRMPGFQEGAGECPERRDW